MNARIETAGPTAGAESLSPEAARRVEALGLGALRLALAGILAGYGALKFAAFEAEAIRPLVENSPLLSWLYAVFSERAASGLIGAVELATAALLLARPRAPRAAALGGLLAAGTFLVTLSFLFTTPGALSPAHPAHGFLVKDVVLLGAALALGGEALRAAVEARGRG